MSNQINRRQVLKGTGLAAASLLASPLLEWASAQSDKTKKVLFFSRSQGFEHAPITRPKNNPEELSWAEKFMIDFGKQHNFDVTCSKDGGLFTPEGLAPFDLIMFYTTGKLDKPLPTGGRFKEQPVNNKPMPPDGKEALLKFVADGKGFLGVHSSTDTWHSDPGTVDPYIQMIGGEFVIHHKQETCKILAADQHWPPINGLSDFELYEEWYILKNLAPDMHVLLVQDTKSMKQKEYNSIPIYPETWARMHGKGRVFYTSMGHRYPADTKKDHHENAWASDIFHKVLLGGIQWAAGNVEAEIKPNIAEVCPDAPRRAPGAI